MATEQEFHCVECRSHFSDADGLVDHLETAPCLDRDRCTHGFRYVWFRHLDQLRSVTHVDFVTRLLTRLSVGDQKN